MNAYLINMDKDVERLEHMRAQAAQKGIDFVRLPAINGRDMPEDEFKAFCDKAPRRKWTRGAMGCFLSHRKAWQAVASHDDEFGLVLEDDMFLSGDFGAFVSDLSWIPADADIVRLETSTNRLKLGRPAPSHGRSVCRLDSTSWCAGAYIIRRRTAERLLATPEDQWDVADYFLFSREESETSRALVICQVSPAIAVQGKYSGADDDCFKSNIEARLGSARTLAERLSIGSIRKAIVRSLRGYRRVPFRP